MPADPQIGPSWMNEDNLPEVESWIVGFHRHSAWIVVSRSMDAWAKYYGAPLGDLGLVRDLPTALHASVVFHNSDATVSRLDLGVASPTPLPRPQPTTQRRPQPTQATLSP